MNIPILYEDDDLLVINKPASVVVNRAESVQGETIQDWAEKRFGLFTEKHNDSDGFAARAGIVHRIDKETSGVLLIAKNPVSFVALQKQFKDRSIQKTYLALVHGRVEPREGSVNAPVGRLPWNRERFGVVPDGREAETQYSVQSYHEGPPVHGKREPLTLVIANPKTGRTHQIRVHMKHIGHPIVGDYLYAGRKTSRNDRQWAPRVMLHAWKVILAHPTGGDPLAIEAAIPEDMNSILRYGLV